MEISIYYLSPVNLIICTNGTSDFWVISKSRLWWLRAASDLCLKWISSLKVIHVSSMNIFTHLCYLALIASNCNDDHVLVVDSSTKALLTLFFTGKSQILPLFGRDKKLFHFLIIKDLFKNVNQLSSFVPLFYH